MLKYFKALYLFLVLQIRDSELFRLLDPGSRVLHGGFPDSGSRIPNPYFRELRNNFWIKVLILCQFAYISVSSENKIIKNFVTIVATKKG
jgi:hypothetical protein